MLRFALTACIALTSLLTSHQSLLAQPLTADYYWTQDLSHSWHDAYSFARISLDDIGFQYSWNSECPLRWLDDEMDLTSGDEAAAGPP